MNPVAGQHIKLLLRNNVFVEGILTEWNPDGVKLESLDGKSIIIIAHLDDIMMIKIFLPEPQETHKEIPSTPLIPQSELEKEFKQVYNQPSETPLRNKSLAELKAMMIDQERQIIANKLKSHHISDTKKVKYGYPRFFTKPRSK